MFRVDLLVLLVLILGALGTARNANGAMDRSVAILGAAVHNYANYLYLTELFKKPSAIPLYEKFCGDVLTEKQIRALKEDLSALRQRGYWDLKCAPVMPAAIQRDRDGTYDLRLRYLKLFEQREWIESIKATVVKKSAAEVLIPSDRGKELSRLLFSERASNIFIIFGSVQRVQVMLDHIYKLAKNIEEVSQTELTGELKFAR